MSCTFTEIAKEIRYKHGFLAARNYLEDIERSGHWGAERIFNRFDAEDGSGSPGNRYANEAYQNLDHRHSKEGN